MKKPRKPIRQEKRLWPKIPTTWVENRTLYVSIPFTWNLPFAKQHILTPSIHWDKVVVGGPAVYIMPEYLDGIPNMVIERDFPGVLQRINPLATRTSKGCVNKCAFCAVRKIDGPEYVEFDEWPVLPIMVDNNLTAATHSHFEKVIERLLGAGYNWCDFNQGLDSRLLEPFHAEQIKRIRKPMIRLALDDFSYADKWVEAVKMLHDYGISKSNIHSYALIGFKDTPEEAWERCFFIEEHGVKPFPMFYSRLDALEERTITKKQKELGWTEKERVKITGFFYIGRFRGNRDFSERDKQRKSFWFFNNKQKRELPK